MEEIKVADTARYVSFYAYDSADHISPADGITGFTVYYFLNNGTPAAIAVETVTEKDSTNMKGWYTLAVDVSAMVSAEGVLSINIEASGMDPVAIKVRIVGNTTKEVYDQIVALNNISTTDVNNQVADVMKTDTTSEMSQGAPPATPTIEEMLAYNYFRMRNKRVVTETEDATYDDAGTTKLYKAAVEEVSDVFTKSEYESGAV
ncbi:MAG: hypothetical protein KAJ93_00965 [Methanosarcinales archaeon]|nr:hypothetical protein [Methanosarcinales archaeon]